MRRTLVLLVLLVALVAETELQQPGGPRSHPFNATTPSRSKAVEHAEHLLTLLDYWNQESMPYVFLAQSRVHELMIGDVGAARRLDRQLARGLRRLQRLLNDAVRDPLLRDNQSVAARAVEAARVAWVEWTAGSLRPRPPSTASFAALEANLVRLNQAAYEAVDASFRTALELV